MVKTGSGNGAKGFSNIGTNKIMEDNGRKYEISHIPIHSDERNNIHIEAPNLQTAHDYYLHHRCRLRTSVETVSGNGAKGISKRGTNKIMEDYGRKYEIHHSPINSDEGCNVHIEVTDTPGVLNNPLSKEHVYSKVPQNKWSEGMFNLLRKHLPVHQLIVVFLFTISFAQGISSHCEACQKMNCTQSFLTCTFDTDIKQLETNLYMKHMQNNSMDFEIILACQRSSDGFHCETTPAYEFVSVESNRLTVKIPEVNLEHVGKYWCDMPGFVEIDCKFCELSLPDTCVLSDCFEQENGRSGKDDRLRPATIAIIVLCITLVLVTILIAIYFRSSGSAKYIATRFSLENCKSGRSSPTTNTREACELL